MRIIEGFKERGGSIIDSQDEVGGYPGMQVTVRKLDIPSDNVEQWLEKMAREIESPGSAGV